MGWSALRSNPVYERERLRGGLASRVLTAVSALCFVFLLLRWGVALGSGRPAVPETFLAYVHHGFALGLILFLPPLLLGTALVEEQTHGTGEMLLLTGFPPEQWLAGKVFALAGPFGRLVAALLAARLLDHLLLFLSREIRWGPGYTAFLATDLLVLLSGPILFLLVVATTLDGAWQWRQLPVLLGMTYLRLVAVGAVLFLFIVAPVSAVVGLLQDPWVAPVVFLFSLLIAGVVARRRILNSFARLAIHLEALWRSDPEDRILLASPQEGQEIDPTQPELPGCLFLILIGLTLDPILREWALVPLLLLLVAMFVYWDARASGFRSKPKTPGFLRMSAGSWSFVSLILPFLGFVLYAVQRNENRTRVAPPRHILAAMALAAAAAVLSAVSLALGRGWTAPLR